MNFDQILDAEGGASLHHVASGDSIPEPLSTDALRKVLKSGDPQPVVRNALGVLDSLLTKRHFVGDVKIFAATYRLQDVAATRAALELIRRQSFTVGVALASAEAAHLEYIRSECARAESLHLPDSPEGDAE
jgi:hypothetical protein